MICDFCIAGRLNWSLIVLASLLFSWLLLLPLLKARGRIIVKFLALLSVAVFPYLFILSRLVEAPMLFRMGAVISLISLIGIWCIYASFVKISSRKIRAAGIVLLIIIPMMWGINSSVAYFLRRPLDSSTKFVDSLMTVLLIISAGSAFGRVSQCRTGNKNTYITFERARRYPPTLPAQFIPVSNEPRSHARHGHLATAGRSKTPLPAAGSLISLIAYCLYQSIS